MTVEDLIEFAEGFQSLIGRLQTDGRHQANVPLSLISIPHR